jgi:hypothetical protein
MWYELAIQPHRLSGLGVTPDPRRTKMKRKTPKPTYLDPISRRQGLGHLLEHGLDGEFYVLGRKLALMGNNSFDQFRLGHGFPF